MIERSCVRISAQHTGWNGHFFTLICCKNCIDVCLKRPKINGKEAGLSHFKKIKKPSVKPRDLTFCLTRVPTTPFVK